MKKSETIRKITISLPEELVEYADHRAEELNTSRSQVIMMALSADQTDYEAQLAAKGYRFYAQEADEFADLSREAVAYAWADQAPYAQDEDFDNGGQAR
jgi:predicted transcriptional regulator